MEAPPPEDDGGVVEEGELFDSVPAAAPTGNCVSFKILNSKALNAGLRLHLHA